jgi:hypothetical protein
MERGSSHPLLRTVMPDGTTYLFVIEADDTWTILHDDHVIAKGAGDERSIGRGTRLFCSLTRIERRISSFPSAPEIADVPSAPDVAPLVPHPAPPAASQPNQEL